MRRLTFHSVCALLCAATMHGPVKAQRPIERVSIGASPRQGNSDSERPSLSADGRYVALASNANNLVVGDRNGLRDVFVYDRQSGDLQRVSVSSSGAEANGSSDFPAISGDGRYVAFTSSAPNLVAGDMNGVGDTFVHDRETGATLRVSVSSAGGEANGASSRSRISADGGVVVFSSDATNLVAGDTNAQRDIFVRDRASGETVRVSVSSSGVGGNGRSSDPALSGDGLLIAFVSLADNLVSGDTNSASDIFVYDRTSGETVRVSVSSSGAQSRGFSANPALSANGRYVAFENQANDLVTQPDTNQRPDIFVHDLDTGETTRVTNGNRDHLEPVLSADGRLVLFNSASTNLDPLDTNGARDVFLHDRAANITVRLSVASSGLQGDGDSGIFNDGLAISAAGDFVAFESRATNLAAGDRNQFKDILLRDMTTLRTTLASVSPLPEEGEARSLDGSLSNGGQRVAFATDAASLVAGDTNLRRDVLVRDRVEGRTVRVSVSSLGVQGNGNSDAPAISADGRLVAFESVATNLVGGDVNAARDVFVHDLEIGRTDRVSVDSTGLAGNGASQNPSLSSDGRYVAFVSVARNLVPSDTNAVRDVFVHDRQTGRTERVSVSSSGEQGNADSGETRLLSDDRYISADGRYVAFASLADNLVPDDANGAWDIFVHDRATRQTTRVSVTSAGGEANAESREVSLSPDGRYVAFGSEASNLVGGDINGGSDVFLHDRQTSTTRRLSVDSAGRQGNGLSFAPAISDGGSLVVFVSDADNLVAMDTNSAADIFLHDLRDASTIRLSVDALGAQNDAADQWPSIAPDGSHVSFASDATDLVPDDGNQVGDVFVVRLSAPVAVVTFLRGDSNTDGTITIADCVSLLGCLFLGTTCPTCLDAADANDDGALSIADCTSTLGCLFLGTACPPPPFLACGEDPTADELGCASFAGCP